MDDTYSKAHLSLYEPILRLVTQEKWKGILLELGVNAPGVVWAKVSGQGKIRLTGRDASWATEDYFWNLCQGFSAANQTAFDKARPILSCRDPLGNRLQVNVGAHVESGIAMTLRIKRKINIGFKDFGMADEKAAEILEAIRSEKTIFVSGGTFTGKTTFLDHCVSHIPEHIRVVVVEDTPEITPPHWDFVRLLMPRVANDRNRIGPREIIDTIMRQNPGAIIMQELSIDNAFPSLRLMGSGHGSFMTTVHSNDPFDALRATKRNIGMSPYGHVNTDEVIEFMAETIDYIIQIEHHAGADGMSDRRVVSSIMSGKEAVRKHYHELKSDHGDAAP